VRLRTNVLWTLAGNAVYGLCQCAMLVALAKIGTPEVVGQFALAFAITAPPMMAANLNLRTVIATDANGGYAFSDYIGLRIISIAVADVVIGAIVAVFYGSEVAAVILLVALAKSIEAISDVLMGLLQQHERMDLASRSFALKGVASVMGLVGGYYVGQSLLIGAVGLVVAWGTVLLSYDLPMARRLVPAPGDALRPRWRWRTQRDLAWLALPLGVATLMASLQANAPRLFVERYLGARQLGFFAAAVYLMMIGARVMTALGEAASPRLAAHFVRGERDRFTALLVSLLGLMLALSLTGVVAAALLGPRILSALYTPEYAAQSRVLVLVLIAAGAWYAANLLQYAMTAARALYPQPFITGTSLVITAAACLLLVPRLGNEGAALAMCLGSFFQFAGNASAVRLAVRRARP